MALSFTGFPATISKCHPSLSTVIIQKKMTIGVSKLERPMKKHRWVFQTPWPEKLKNSTSPSPVLRRIVSNHWILDVNICKSYIHILQICIYREIGRTELNRNMNKYRNRCWNLSGTAIFRKEPMIGCSQVLLLVLHRTTTAYAEWCSDASVSKPSMSYLLENMCVYIYIHILYFCLKILNYYVIQI